jgi:hypothetical protein
MSEQQPLIRDQSNVSLPDINGHRKFSYFKPKSKPKVDPKIEYLEQLSDAKPWLRFIPL